jgi:predicted PurR-regulated permease PerM
MAILLGFLFLAYRMVQPYLLSLVMGGILALLAWPLRRRLTEKGTSPRLASGLVTIGVVSLVVTPLLTFASIAINEGVNAAKSMGGAESLSLDGLKGMLTSWPPLARIVDAVQIDEYITRGLQSLGRSASNVVLNMAKSIPEGSLQILLICLACYFMLVDGPGFLRWASFRFTYPSIPRW